MYFTSTIHVKMNGDTSRSRHGKTDSLAMGERTGAAATAGATSEMDVVLAIMARSYTAAFAVPEGSPQRSYAVRSRRPLKTRLQHFIYTDTLQTPVFQS